MKKSFRKFSIRNIAYFGLFLLMAVMILGLPKSANAVDVAATFGNVIKTITASPILISIGIMAALMTVLFGAINSLIIGAIVALTSYNNFVNESSIIGAWVIIRDLCNMFFILILLVVAFAAILRIESYQWKKILPKLLIMAVLINFSRTFCGLIIDASQIIMLTFVNAWAGNGSGFVVMTRMTTYFSSVIGNEFSKITTQDYSILNIVAGMLIGIMFLIISGIVLMVALAVFLMRVIMLWIYIVLSPLAFMASAFPAGQKYASQWWSEFIKYIINGPVLAFFIWMAFIVSAQIDKNSSILFPDVNGQCFGLTQGMCLNNFLPFIISIGMLLGGLMITQQIGGVGSSIAGKGLDWAKKSLTAVGKGSVLGGKTLTNYGVNKLHQKTGVDLNIPRAWKVLQERRAERKQEMYTEGQSAAGRAMKEGGRIHGILATTGSPGDAYDELSHTEGIIPRGLIQRLQGGKKLKEKSAAMEPGLAQAEFESKYIGANESNRIIEIKKLTDKSIAIDKDINEENNKGPKKDITKIDNLKKQREIIDKQKVFVAANPSYKIFSDAEQNASQEKAEKMREQYNKYQLRTPFEARAAEQKAVSAKMAKIKDISAPTELLRMLQDAIKQHDKTMVKAITLKMTRDYNDNEFLLPLAGDTSHVGLKKLMKDFADKNSKNYAGFGQQEAFGLGSQIAELNKATHHWAATSAYLMEDGKWRETTDSEHAEIRTTETGKMHPQSLVRLVNRLGFGKHTNEGYKLDVGGLITLKQLDNPGGIKQLGDNMTESTVKYLHANIGQLRAMGELSDALLNKIEERAGEVSDFDTKFAEYSEKLKSVTP